MVGELADKVRQFKGVAHEQSGLPTQGNGRLPGSPSGRGSARLPRAQGVAPQGTYTRAGARHIAVVLTDEQVAAVLEQWRAMGPAGPAELTLYAGRRPLLHVRVSRSQLHE